MIFMLPHFITLLLESVGGDSSSGRVMRIAMYCLSKWSSSQGLQHEAAEVPEINDTRMQTAFINAAPW